jgi:hypothetical protein
MNYVEKDTARDLKQVRHNIRMTGYSVRCDALIVRFLDCCKAGLGHSRQLATCLVRLILGLKRSSLKAKHRLSAANTGRTDLR